MLLYEKVGPAGHQIDAGRLEPLGIDERSQRQVRSRMQGQHAQMAQQVRAVIAHTRAAVGGLGAE